jgi:hypoxanthine phosphoribosyltransferase
VPVTVDYAAWKEANGYLVGYGLDYADRYRELPGIFHLQTEEKS